MCSSLRLSSTKNLALKIRPCSLGQVIDAAIQRRLIRRNYFTQKKEKKRHTSCGLPQTSVIAIKKTRGCSLLRGPTLLLFSAQVFPESQQLNFMRICLQMHSVSECCCLVPNVPLSPRLSELGSSLADSLSRTIRKCSRPQCVSA